MTAIRDKMQTLCPMIENALEATLGESDERRWYLAVLADDEVSLASNIADPALVRQLAESIARNIERTLTRTHVVPAPGAKQ